MNGEEVRISKLKRVFENFNSQTAALKKRITSTLKQQQQQSPMYKGSTVLEAKLLKLQEDSLQLVNDAEGIEQILISMNTIYSTTSTEVNSSMPLITEDGKMVELSHISSERSILHSLIDTDEDVDDAAIQVKKPRAVLSNDQGLSPTFEEMGNHNMNTDHDDPTRPKSEEVTSETKVVLQSSTPDKVVDGDSLPNTVSGCQHEINDSIETAPDSRNAALQTDLISSPRASDASTACSDLPDGVVTLDSETFTTEECNIILTVLKQCRHSQSAWTKLEEILGRPADVLKQHYWSKMNLHGPEEEFSFNTVTPSVSLVQDSNMEFYARNGYDHEKQELLNQNKVLTEKLQQMKNNFKTVEEMNVKLAERVKQQSSGMISLVKDHEKHVQYCVANFNKQMKEATDLGLDWHHKAVALEKSLNEAQNELNKLKRRTIYESSNRKRSENTKKRSLTSTSTDSEVLDNGHRFRPMTIAPLTKKLKSLPLNQKSNHHKKKMESESESDEVSWTAEEDSESGNSNESESKSYDSGESEASHKERTRLFWDHKMDIALKKAVEKYGKDWVKISQITGLATNQQCGHRWAMLMSRSQRQNTQTKKSNVTSKVKKEPTQRNGQNQTNNSKINNGTIKQPDKSKTGRYSHREDDIILSAVASRGSQDPSLWSDLSAIFGRSETSVEQRWKALCEGDDD